MLNVVILNVVVLNVVILGVVVLSVAVPISLRPSVTKKVRRRRRR